MPNSLGPGELLQHYGTDERKITICRVWRVVRRSPALHCQPGSGFRCGRDSGHRDCLHGEWQGQQVLGMRLTWNKRYIRWHRLRPCLGWRLNSPTRKNTRRCRRFRHYLCADPDHHAGVEIGRRHFPLNVPFQNGPTAVKMSSCRSITSSAGRKWPGRLADAGGVPLGRPRHHPAFHSTGGVKSVALATGAYAHIRVSSKSLLVRWKGLKSRWRVFR